MQIVKHNRHGIASLQRPQQALEKAGAGLGRGVQLCRHTRPKLGQQASKFTPPNGSQALEPAIAIRLAQTLTQRCERCALGEFLCAQNQHPPARTGELERQA